MKVPLRYQISECDCCPTTVLNGMSYLLERQDIPPEVVRNVYLYSMDNFRADGYGARGTTHAALRYLTEWIERFGKTGQLNISSRYISEEQVSLEPDGLIAETIRNGGAAVTRIDLDGWHYILMTGLDEEYVYAFDPYKLDEPFPVPGVRVIADHELEYNRIIPRVSFATEDVHPYSFGPYQTRDAMLLTKRTEPGPRGEAK